MAAKQAPARPAPSAASSASVSSSDTKSLSAAMTGSARTAGSGNASSPRGEKGADWALPSSGSPVPISPAHSGASPRSSRSRTRARNGMICSGMSLSSPLAGTTGTGTISRHGRHW